MYINFVPGNEHLNDLLNDPELEYNTDVPVLLEALMRPNNIRIIPKYMYDHSLKFLEDREEYEYCAEFIKIKDKVVDMSLEDIVNAKENQY